MTTPIMKDRAKDNTSSSRIWREEYKTYEQPPKYHIPNRRRRDIQEAEFWLRHSYNTPK